ncbi:MAG TPA: hypothetical protein VK893_00220 [Pyrinomonadaceae bacterium]|nr:hypothetical protein [Pyrinomonadaceae bacterium]
MRVSPIRFLLWTVVLVVTTAVGAVGQSAARLPKKLPSAEKIVENYFKAIGGKKAAAAQKDAIYEWSLELNNQPIGTARTVRKVPAAERLELTFNHEPTAANGITFNNGQIIAAANTRSAWEIGLDKQLHTLTSLEAATAKLQATLAASRLVDFKKSHVLARVVSLGDLGSEPAYIVEFSTRSGARVQYYFSTKTKLITKITSDGRKTRILFEDYRPQNGVLEPHRVRINLPAIAEIDNGGELTLLLQSVKYNTGVAEQVFDPPRSMENLDVTALLREVARNQDDTENRVAEYSFKQTETDREINSKGELKKQTVKVYEVYPLPNRAPVEKLISENGVPLSPERAAKEEKRVQEEFLKAEREKEKDAQQAARQRAAREKKHSKEEVVERNPAISLFLRACDFISPRREVFAGRESIVFDFRPRAGFKPKTREESLIAKLAGVVWIDPVDKQVMRLEARLAEGFKMAGGLLVSLKPGAGLVMEQTRMVQGVWLPRFAQINLSVKVLLFAGGDYNKTIEWSDYKHFSGDVKDYKIEAPATAKP